MSLPHLSSPIMKRPSPPYPPKIRYAVPSEMYDCIEENPTSSSSTSHVPPKPTDPLTSTTPSTTTIKTTATFDESPTIDPLFHHHHHNNNRVRAPKPPPSSNNSNDGSTNDTSSPQRTRRKKRQESNHNNNDDAKITTSTPTKPVCTLVASSPQPTDTNFHYDTASDDDDEPWTWTEDDNDLHSDHQNRPTNERLLWIAFVSFFSFALLQTVASIVAESEAMMGDSAAMMVDALTYLFNLLAERQKTRYKVSYTQLQYAQQLRRRQQRRRRRKQQQQNQHHQKGKDIDIYNDTTSTLHEHYQQHQQHQEELQQQMEDDNLQLELSKTKYQMRTFQMELIPPLISVLSLLVVTFVVSKEAIYVLSLDLGSGYYYDSGGDDDDNNTNNNINNTNSTMDNINNTQQHHIESDPNLNLMMLFSLLNLALDGVNVFCFAKAEHAMGYKTTPTTPTTTMSGTATHYHSHHHKKDRSTNNRTSSKRRRRQRPKQKSLLELSKNIGVLHHQHDDVEENESSTIMRPLVEDDDLMARVSPVHYNDERKESNQLNDSHKPLTPPIATSLHQQNKFEIAPPTAAPSGQAILESKSNETSIMDTTTTTTTTTKPVNTTRNGTYDNNGIHNHNVIPVVQQPPTRKPLIPLEIEELPPPRRHLAYSSRYSNGHDATNDDDEEEEEEEVEDDNQKDDSGANLNMCSAYTHVFADTLRSTAVIIAAGLAEFVDAISPEVADASAALIVSILIALSLIPLFSGLVQTIGSLRDATSVYNEVLTRHRRRQQPQQHDLDERYTADDEESNEDEGLLQTQY